MASGSWWTDYVRDNLSIGLAVASAVAFVLERSKRRKAEKEMTDIKRRGRAPFLYAEFIISGYTTDPLETPARIDQVPNGSAIPDTVPAGHIVTLTCSNRGEHVRNVRAEVAHGLRFFCHDGEFKTGWDSASLTYAYKPELRGAGQRITVTFETFDGVVQSQTYEMKHGYCSLERVDPA